MTAGFFKDAKKKKLTDLSNWFQIGALIEAGFLWGKSCLSFPQIS
jgi:hypothetical protein